MSVRTVLAVVLAVAVCSVSYPAIDDARTTRAEYRADRELASVSRSLVDLEDESAVPLGDPGARSVVALSLPRASATTAGIEYVAIGGVPETRDPHDPRDTPHAKDDYGDVFAYRVEGGSSHVRHVPFDLRVAASAPDDADGGRRLAPDGTPLVVRGERARVALVPVEHRGKRIVVVVRAAEL